MRTVIANFSAKKAQAIGLYAPTTARFYLRNSNMAGPANLFFGYRPINVGWKPLIGDWNGPML